MRAHPTAVIVLLYLLVNAFIWVAADPGCRVVGASCYEAANHWAAPIAQALLEYGAPVWPDNPSEPFTAWPPGGAFIEAMTRVIGPSDSVALYVALQIAATLAVGFLVRSLVNEVRAPYGDAAMAIFLLNPNVLTLANMPQGEIFQMCLVALAFACIWRFAVRPSLFFPIACGALLGISTLVRPDTLYLCVILPVAFPLLAWAAGHRRYAWKAIGGGIAGTILAFAILSPWYMYVAKSGEGVRFAERSQEYLYFLDNLRFLSPDAPGRLVPEVKRTYWQKQDAVFAETVPGWETMTDRERAVLRLDAIHRYYLSGEISGAVMAEALVWSWARTLLNPGSSWTQTLFTGEDPDAAGPAPLVLQAPGAAYTLLARLLGLLGLFELARRRRYDLLLAFTGLFSYFLMIHLFNGQSRYRVPMEPQLAMVAAFGLAWCVERLSLGRVLRRNVRGAA